MSKYALFHGTRQVEPAGRVIRIYHGAKLIWERENTVVYDSTLSTYRFTKSGILAPSNIDGGIARFLNKNGSVAADVDFSGLISESERLSFLWSDMPLYRISALQDDNSIMVLRDYIEADTAVSFNRRQLTPSLTDTAEQWASYTHLISDNLANSPTVIAGNACGGIIPMTRPLGYIDGSQSGVDSISQLCYVRDGSIITDAGYIVLAVCGERMLCAENVTINSAGVAYGLITERSFDGSVIRQAFAKRRRLVDYTDDEWQMHYSIAGDYVSYYTTQSSKQYLAVSEIGVDGSGGDGYSNSALKGIPENICHHDGTYYLIRSDGTIAYGDTPMFKEYNDYIYPHDDEFGDYTVNNPTSPGSYYIGEDGLYVIGKSIQTDENGKHNYKVLKVNI